jgi:hypothetical protein
LAGGTVLSGEIASVKDTLVIGLIVGGGRYRKVKEFRREKA